MAAKKPKSQTFTFKTTIALSPTEASRMFTHATALRDWFCDWASLDSRKDGVIMMRWESGFYASGQFTVFDPGKKLAFTWDGKDEPAPTRVTVSFKAKGSGTEVTVTHSGVGSGRSWAATIKEIESGWRESLENLKSVAETGIDLRLARRPRLGIFVEEYNPEFAKRLGVPAKSGIRIAGTAEGSGARAAGLEKDDVVVKFNGRAVIFETLGIALKGLKAGDSVPLEWYRGKNKLKGKLQLGSFPMPAVPATAAELADTMRQRYAGLDEELRKAVAGVSEREAEHKAGQEWSVKELIAHFIACERDYQSWVADMLHDNTPPDSLEFRPNMDERLRSIVARFQTVAGLLAELTAAEAETVGLLANLPDSFLARKHWYRRAALWELEFTSSHFKEEHSEQLKAAIAAARAG